MKSKSNEWANNVKMQGGTYMVKTVQFVEAVCNDDIVVRDIKQQRSLCHHYKISNLSIMCYQKNRK